MLDATISDYCFNQFPHKSEGELTIIRAKIVNRERLNTLGSQLGLNQFLRKGKDVQSPSLAGNALEALIGAIYMDRGYRAAQKFVVRRIMGSYLDMNEIDAVETDYKSRFIEYTQKHSFPYSFKTLETTNGGDSRFESEIKLKQKIVAKGVGGTKKTAEQNASQNFFDSQ